MVTRKQVVISFLALPGMVLIAIPLIIHNFTPITLTERLIFASSKWILFPLFAGLGSALIAITNIAFIRIGTGTLAPWHPTQFFVARGPYLYVRHPMIIGVLLILLGEVFLLGSWGSIAWFAFCLIANLIYLPLVEEKALIKRFGNAYREYQKNVPAWIPRCSPWDPLTGKWKGNNFQKIHIIYLRKGLF